jgi:hypothetical protein
VSIYVTWASTVNATVPYVGCINIHSVLRRDRHTPDSTRQNWLGAGVTGAEQGLEGRWRSTSTAWLTGRLASPLYESSTTPVPVMAAAAH